MLPRREILPRAIAVETFGNVIIYALIVCGHYAYDYYQKYRDREMRSVELEGRLAQRELQNVKMQLQPHFLFNTLHTISVLMMRDANLANRRLIRLSDLLRITLDNTGSQMVPRLCTKSRPGSTTAALPPDVRQGYALPGEVLFQLAGYARGSGLAQSFRAKGRTRGRSPRL